MRFAARRATRGSIVPEKGLPLKVKRGVRQFKRTVACRVGVHRYVIDWNAPIGALAARCGWCGTPGPWRRSP